jgi:hypothetical protein
MNLLNFFKPRLVQSCTTVIIPLYDCVFFIRSLNCAEFFSRLSEVTQALDPISGTQLRIGRRGLDEPWSLGTV